MKAGKNMKLNNLHLHRSEEIVVQHLIWNIYMEIQGLNPDYSNNKKLWTQVFIAYNNYLQISSETIDGSSGGLYSKTLSRSYANTGVIGRYTGVNIGSEYGVTYGYDTYGRPSSLTNGSDEFTYNYLPSSNLISSISYPHGISVASTYEANRNLVTQVKNTYNTSTTVSQYDYSNNVLGNRTSMGKSGTAFTQSDTITYGYNDRSEVTGANAANNANYGYSFAFDPIGNRLTSASKETGTTVTRSYTSNNINQYTAIDNPTAAPTYDFDGNITSMPSFAESGTWSLTWDAENRLVLAEKSDAKLEFKYDYVGRRVEKKIYSGSTGNWTLAADLRFVYDGYLQIEELALDIPNSQFVIRNCRVWSPALQGLGSEKYLSETQGETTYYALGDANKNVTEYLDASGNIKAHYEFSPFGKVVTATGSMSGDFNYRFSSEYLDVETGLIYYNFRYYSPELGRWLSRDPIGELGSDNLYAMCFNSPMYYFDHLGKESVKQNALDTALKSIGSKSTSKDLQNIKGTPYLKDPSTGKILRADISDAAHGNAPNVHVYDNLKDVKNNKCFCKIFTDETGLKLKSLKLLGVALAGVSAMASLDAIADSPHYRGALEAALRGDTAKVESNLQELALDVSLSSGSDVPVKVQAAREAGVFDYGLESNIKQYQKSSQDNEKYVKEHGGLLNTLIEGIKDIFK